ncbi:MAG: addiction module protein, partial [Gammaproteobacteria bacterium]
MAINFEQLQKEIQTLSMEEKATLAHSLIEALESSTDENAESLWIEEAKSRYESYLKGDLEVA